MEFIIQHPIDQRLKIDDKNRLLFGTKAQKKFGIKPDTTLSLALAKQDPDHFYLLKNIDDSPVEIKVWRTYLYVNFSKFSHLMSPEPSTFFGTPFISGKNSGIKIKRSDVNWI